MAIEAPAGRHLPAPVISRCWGRARQLTSQPRVHATAAWRRELFTPQVEAGKAGAGESALAQFSKRGKRNLGSYDLWNESVFSKILE